MFREINILHCNSFNTHSSWSRLPFEFLTTTQIQPQHLSVYVKNPAKASDKLPHFLLHWIYLELTKAPENDEVA